MVFVWDEKTNFILLHHIHLQQQSLTSTIDWLAIVRDIRLEISSTPTLLKDQYEYLLQSFHLENDSKSLLTIVKRVFLNSLCQQIENHSKSSVEIVYEFVRNIRAKRITQNDIEQLIQQWNFKSSSDEQKKNEEHLYNILVRLRDYTQNWSTNSLADHSSKPSNANISPGAVPKEDNDEDSTNNEPNQLMTTTDEGEKSSVIYRRRTRSLTIAIENQDPQVNIGIEWFVPKLRHPQRSSSLHDRSESPVPINSTSSQTLHLPTERIPIPTINIDESSNSINDIQPRQNEPVISWQPLTNEQILGKERQQLQSSSLHLEDLEEVSSSDSDSIKIESSVSSTHKTSNDFHEDDDHSCKRQRLLDED